MNDIDQLNAGMAKADADALAAGVDLMELANLHLDRFNELLDMSIAELGGPIPPGKTANARGDAVPTVFARKSGGRIILDDAVSVVLKNAVYDGRLLSLPGNRLDPKLYKRVDACLKALGGKWSRSDNGHVFKSDAKALVEAALGAGQVIDNDKALGFFRTPSDLAWKLVSMADPNADCRILEPSAGDGAIARLALHYAGPESVVDVCEVDDGRRKSLSDIEGVRIVGTNFLEYAADGSYGRIIANPPFGRGTDIDHVLHMHRCLSPGGRLVSLMADNARTAKTRKAVQFRELVEAHDGEFQPLPAGSFKESGTDVSACVVQMGKRSAAPSPASGLQAGVRPGEVGR